MEKRIFAYKHPALHNRTVWPPDELVKVTFSTVETKRVITFYYNLY